jgi:hypothetical protein
MSSALCASAPSHLMHAMPPRITRNSDRPRASDRTMVDTQIPRSACQVLRLDWRRRHRKMKATDMQTSPKGTSRANRGAHSQAVGWISRQKSSRRPVEGETFFLTSLFIELIEHSRPYEAVQSFRFRAVNGLSRSYPVVPERSGFL